MKRKELWKILLPVTAVILAGLAVLLFEMKKPDQDDTIKIGVTVYKNDTFVSNMMTSLKHIVGEYEQETGVRINLNIMDAQGSQATQNDQVSRFISLGYNVLCVNPVDRTDAARMINQAMNANIPVVFFNREPVQSDLKKWDKLYYVGADAQESAKMQASIVIDAYQKTPEKIDKNGDGVVQYIMIEGESRHQDTVIRTEVSVQTLKESGMKLEKLDGGIANWDRNQASALADQYFSLYGDQIELIICNNDDMALGVCDAVERLGRSFSNIVGIDATPQGIEAVDAGKMLGTVSIGYDSQAQAIFEIAWALANGEDVTRKYPVREDQSVRVPQYIYTAKENGSALVQK